MSLITTVCGIGATGSLAPTYRGVKALRFLKITSCCASAKSRTVR
jgi:hypothetical protein